MKVFSFRQLDRKAFDSRIKSDTVKNTERWIGFFLGPALVATSYATVSGAYLNLFYTDVLHIGSIGAGLFLALMPVFSKVLDAITNVFMGRVVDSTVSRQGKARPWILLSGPLMFVSLILLFMVPVSANTLLTAVWVTCSYNLYFCVSYTMYNLSNVVTLPLSTRDSKKRDTLAMAQSIGINMVPGLILAVIFPSFIQPYIGVDQGKWIRVMFMMAFLAVVGTLLQYFFIRERVTEEGGTEKEKSVMPVSLKDQVKGCLGSRYWVLIMVALLAYYLCHNVGVNSMLYYANWVVGTYNDGKTLTLLNMVGQALLGPGVLVIWPLVRKVGKQKLFVGCGMISVAGGLLGMFYGSSFMAALGALTLRSIGELPVTYLMLSVLADALDHVEYKAGFRCDGFSSSVYSIIITVSAGVGLGILNLGLSQSGYIAPLSDGSWVEQTAAVKNFLIFATFGFPAVGALIIAIVFGFFNLEKTLPEMQEEIKKRRGEA